jgi:hypothetical protein
VSTDPVDALVAAVCPLFAGRAAVWKLRGEALAGGGVRMTVTNVARGETWPVEMSKAEARQLAAGLNRSAGGELYRC